MLKHCYQTRIPNKKFSSVEDAKTACLNDNMCKGVYDKGCDKTFNNVIHLCQVGGEYWKSSGSCVYDKMGKNFAQL